MVGPSRPEFVLFGSSIVQLSFSHGGWASILADIYARKADIILRGYNGWNSTRAVEALDQIFPKDADVQPELVIVYFGGNDSMGPHSSGLGPHVPLPEAFQRKPNVTVLSCPLVNEETIRLNTSPNLSEIVRTNELCHKYSEACIKLCHELGVKVILTFSVRSKNEVIGDLFASRMECI